MKRALTPRKHNHRHQHAAPEPPPPPPPRTHTHVTDSYRNTCVHAAAAAECRHAEARPPRAAWMHLHAPLPRTRETLYAARPRLCSNVRLGVCWVCVGGGGGEAERGRVGARQSRVRTPYQSCPPAVRPSFWAGRHSGAPRCSRVRHGAGAHGEGGRAQKTQTLPALSLEQLVARAGRGVLTCNILTHIYMNIDRTIDRSIDRYIMCVCV